MTAAAFVHRVDATFMSWTVQDVLAATGARAALDLRRDASFVGVTTDSRTATPGTLFFALRGPRYDGHDYVGAALQKGAGAAVVEHPPVGIDPRLLLRVPDALHALGDLAAWTRARYPVRVVAVTGSNGKTTTKEMIAAVCQAAKVGPSGTGILKTEGNLNNLIGLPLTLLRLCGDEAVAILEMGMNQPGEIARLTEIAQPKVAVITNIGPVHLAGVGGTIAGVAAAKGELFAGLSADAVIAVNVDDEWVQRVAGPFRGRKITFGRTGEISARGVTDLGTDGVGFDLVIGAQRTPVRLRLLGLHNVSNALAAAAIGHALGCDSAAIAQGLEQTQAVHMRMQIQHLPNGITVINDAYNANPSSVGAALEALTRLPGRRLVVLGEMRELGDESRRAHLEIGERAASLGVEYLFLLGEYADAMADGARAGGLPDDRVHVCRSHAEVAEAVVAGWRPGDTVLVKGSRGMEMEEVVRLLEGARDEP
jgi:UDP-N-acetylmuramoyl-tripeptide--D-alanyl-D-alanine ligase